MIIIFHAFIIAMIVLFLHSTTWDGNIFEGIKKIIKPEGKLYKPVYGCPVCMAPYYGTLIYFIFFGHNIGEWLLTVFTGSGLSVFSVIAITIKDYAKSRTIETDEKKIVDAKSKISSASAGLTTANISTPVHTIDVDAGKNTLKPVKPVSKETFFPDNAVSNISPMTPPGKQVLELLNKKSKGNVSKMDNPPIKPVKPYHPDTFEQEVLRIKPPVVSTESPTKKSIPASIEKIVPKKKSIKTKTDGK